MKKLKFRAAVLQIMAILLFFSLAFGATAASVGLFNSNRSASGQGDSPFDQLFRPDSQKPADTTDSDAPADPNTPGTPGTPGAPSVQAGYVQNLSNAFNTGLIEGYTNDRSSVSLSQRVELHNRLTASIGTVDGTITPVTYQTYNSDAYMLAKRLQLEYDYIEGTEIITKYSKQYSNQDATYQTVATPYLVGRKTVQPYMGYLLISRVELRQVEIIVPPVTEPETEEPSTTPITAPETTEETPVPDTAPLPTPDDTENTPTSSATRQNESPEIRYETVEVTVLSLHDRNGNLLIDDLGTKKPYYARDYSNRPIFVDEDELLYAFNGTKFISVDKGDLRSNLFYDYPELPLGVYKGVYEAHYSEKLGGYHYINYKNGGSIYSSNYFKAFNYSSNGIAVVVAAKDNTIMLINRNKTQVLKAPYQWYVFHQDPVTGRKQYARDYFAFPDTLGIESIGCTGYDNGWLRIRLQSFDMASVNRSAIIQDKYILIDSKGNRFDIPEGYTLEGYSDGVLLLSKDGLYGYYSLEGKWIAQPIYSYARPFIQGLAVVGSENGTMGMIDTKGNIVLPFVYTSVSDISSGMVVTYCEGIGWETYELIAK